MRNNSNFAHFQASNQELLDENVYLREKLAAMENAAEMKQELLDENAYLREKSAAMEDAAELKQELIQTLSSAINIGYWEWDETTKRPAYFSKEMADIIGISLDSLYETYRCEDDYFHFVHPDDL